jgi:hypothetical protein
MEGNLTRCFDMGSGPVHIALDIQPAAVSWVTFQNFNSKRRNQNELA